MELRFQVACLQDLAVVNCSGSMVRGAALDQFRRRIDQLERVRVLVLDVSAVEQLDAGGLGTLLLVRRWATQRSAKMKLVNPPVSFRRMLEVTHLNSVFEISSLREAICILRANAYRAEGKQWWSEVQILSPRPTYLESDNYMHMRCDSDLH